MKNSKGFTLIELVVTIVLVGILLGTAIPTYNSTLNQTQRSVNISNMTIIKNVFIQYYQDNHMIGNPHFPQEPYNSMMDSTFRKTELLDGRTPDMLFSGQLPYNTNNNPYKYQTGTDTINGSVTNTIIISDIDPDSPSYLDKVIGEM